MARKRMLNNSIINAEPFYALTKDAQLAYIYLNLGADDEGFIATPSKELYPVRIGMGAVEELVQHGFLLEFVEKDTKVYVITHFFVHNNKRKDRYTPTYYSEIRERLALDKNGKYVCDQNLESFQNLVAIDKIRLDKIREDESSICAEPGKPPGSTHPNVTGILCTNGELWYPTFESFERYKTLYPGVNIEMEFLKMAQWSEDNPKRRKTFGGCGRFVSSWLDRAQNSRWGKPKANPPSANLISYVKEQEEWKANQAENYDEEEEIRKTLEALAKSSEGG